MFNKTILYATIGVLIMFVFSSNTTFSSMQSSNYRVESDSINFGGADSSSESFSLKDTMGEVATGDSSSANYAMRAGFQQMNGAYIAMTGPDVDDLGHLSGIIGGANVSSTTVNVVTDSYGGYQLIVQASTTPALKSGSSAFNDYAPVGSNPDYLFMSNPNDSTFGFSVNGNDTSSRFFNDGALCNAGPSSTAQRCWDGFSTTPQVIAESHTSNHPSGTDTTLYFKAEIGSNKFQDPGVYEADITLTAVAL